MTFDSNPLHQTLPWEEPGWIADVETWVEQELAKIGRQMIGPVDFRHMKAWSALASAQTTDGTVFFKSPVPRLHYEVALTQLISALRPDSTPTLLASDTEKGWLLTADSGPTLREVMHSVADLQHYDRMLPYFAELQIEMASHLSTILQTGIPDRRLAIFPRLYRELLEDKANLRVDNPPGLTTQEHQHLIDRIPRVIDDCERLASFALPETLCHEEVHDANVLYHGSRYLFIDWADSCVGHPFFSMLVTVRSAAFRLQLDEYSPEMMRLRDAYLEAWTTFHPAGVLREAYSLAYPLAMIMRSLSYRDVLGPLPESYKIENDAIPGWLQDYLEV